MTDLLQLLSIIKVNNMDFKDQIKQLSARVEKIKDNILTEEATKNAFIMPFIQALGYDVFDPTEVVPELDCDLVKKKGEKIDYAIQKDGETIMLFECKHWQQDLNLHETQLQRYFTSSKARFGVLTNGIEYRFYSDLNKPNLMDTTPFLVVNMAKLKEDQITALRQFHKSYFNLEDILSSASELKYMSELKAVIRDEFQSPSDDMVRLLAKRVFEGMVTQKVIEQFREIVKRSLNDHINDAIADRLNIAISLVKSILRNVLPSERITYRDAQTYFAILIDDNNRKTICRLYFNSANKRIGIVKGDKSEVRYPLTTLDDIFTHAEELKEEAKRFKED